MIISDLHHLETVNESVSIVGGRRSSAKVNIEVSNVIRQDNRVAAQAVGRGASTGLTLGFNAALQLNNIRDNNAGNLDLGDG